MAGNNSPADNAAKRQPVRAAGRAIRTGIITNPEGQHLKWDMPSRSPTHSAASSLLRRPSCPRFGTVATFRDY